MSWFVVGGIAIGATAGAIAGSEKGGDDVWKGALIGGALGGLGGAGAGALAGGAGAAGAGAGVAGAEGAALGGAEAAVAGGAGVGAVAPAGIMGAEAAGSGLALGGAGLETGGAMAGGAGIAGGAAPAAATVAPEAGAGILGGGAAPAALPGGASFGGTGGATVGSTGGFAPGMQAPIELISAPSTGGGTFGTAEAFGANPAALPGGNASFGSTGGATIGDTGGAYNLGAAPKSPLQSGFDSALNWLSEPKNAMLTGVLGLGAISMFNNQNDQTFGNQTVMSSGYPMSPDFKPTRVNPQQYRYRSSYADGGLTDLDVGRREMYARQAADPITMMASGGIASYARGGDTRKQLAMIDPRAGEVSAPPAPSYVGSAGIYSDDDADTRSQDALTAAQTRMAKAAKRAGYKLSTMQKAEPIDELNLVPVTMREEKMASGGISSLGDYAAGGSPRLLRGPGDGMSDDIPASIADKQPARLADGEFVVPADVVSGLGNGSTEAGAKKLHKMMDKVRVDRTGTKKQGREIKAEKYIPGMASGGIASYAEGSLVVNPETNEVGYWTGDDPWNRSWNPITQDQYTSSTAAAPATPATTYQQQLVNPGQFAVGGQNTPDYRVPGATLTGNLGRWSNVAGEAERAARPASANQLITQAYLNNLGRAPEQAGFNHWMDQAGAPTTQANFNEAAYLRANPDVAAAVERGQFGSGYEHYSQYGRNESRAGAGSNLPSVLENIANSAEARNVRYGNVSADPAAYLRANPDVAAAGVDPMQHYIDYGSAEGRNVRPAAGPAVTPPQINTHPTSNAPLAFDPSFYLRQNPDVAAAGVDPMQHYIEYGRREGRLPYEPVAETSRFDPQYYLAQNPDVAQNWRGTPLQHFLAYGYNEGRTGSAPSAYQQATQAALAQAQAAQGQATEAASSAAEARRRGGILAAKK